MEIYQTTDFDFELTVGLAALKIRGANSPASFDEHMQLLRKYPNRLRIASLIVIEHERNEPGKEIAEVSFNMIANPHPKCDFDYICIYMSFSSWPEARITDMSPREVKGEQPLKYTAKYGGGLALKINKIELGPLFSTEKSMNDVYFIKMRATGIDDNLAALTFEKEPNTRLHFNNLLTLLIEHETKGRLKPPKFEVEANLRLEDGKDLYRFTGAKPLFFNNTANGQALSILKTHQTQTL